MFEHQKIKELNDFFTNLSSRTEKSVYFYRINAYTDEIGEFIKKYYETARTRGVIIEGKIPNPNEKNLSYYSEIMGMEFRMHPGFIEQSLKKWLPRMNDYQRRNVTLSVYDSLDEMRRSGKNENMLRNAYIKFMCWLYYKFERIVNLLGEEQIPKILYEGDISKYELMLISILCKAGCDVVLLQYRGDGEYRKLDPESALSSELSLPGMQIFPPEYSLRRVREEMPRDVNNARLYGKRPELLNCTNAWMEGKYKVLEEVKNSSAARGKEPKLFYNCFCRINGVEDRLTYLNELYLMHQELKNCKRRTVIVDGTIPLPSSDEISMIKRGNYNNQNNMLFDLTGNIQYANSMELQRLMIKAFLDVLLEEAEKPENNLNRLTNKAVYLLCWLKRYWQTVI